MTNTNTHEEKTAFSLNIGDEISTDELVNKKRGFSSQFEQPNTDTCVIVECREIMDHKDTVIAISTANGYHGMVEIGSEETITVLSEDNPPNRNMPPMMKVSGSRDASKMKYVAFPSIVAGNVVEGGGKMGREAVVYDSIGTFSNNIVLAVGECDTIQGYIMGFDGDAHPTAVGYNDIYCDSATPKMYRDRPQLRNQQQKLDTSDNTQS